MRATAIEVTEATAVVELRPCWLARLLGARTVRVEMVRLGGGWLTAATHDLMHRAIARDRLILDALDFRPTAALPCATMRRR